MIKLPSLSAARLYAQNTCVNFGLIETSTCLRKSTPHALSRMLDYRKKKHSLGRICHNCSSLSFNTSFPCMKSCCKYKHYNTVKWWSCTRAQQKPPHNNPSPTDDLSARRLGGIHPWHKMPSDSHSHVHICTNANMVSLVFSDFLSMYLSVPCYHGY